MVWKIMETFVNESRTRWCQILCITVICECNFIQNHIRRPERDRPQIEAWRSWKQNSKNHTWLGSVRRSYKYMIPWLELSRLLVIYIPQMSALMLMRTPSYFLLPLLSPYLASPLCVALQLPRFGNPRSTLLRRIFPYWYGNYSPHEQAAKKNIILARYHASMPRVF